MEVKPREKEEVAGIKISKVQEDDKLVRRLKWVEETDVTEAPARLADKTKDNEKEMEKEKPKEEEEVTKTKRVQEREEIGRRYRKVKETDKGSFKEKLQEFKYVKIQKKERENDENKEKDENEKEGEKEKKRKTDQPPKLSFKTKLDRTGQEGEGDHQGPSLRASHDNPA